MRSFWVKELKRIRFIQAINSPNLILAAVKGPVVGSDVISVVVTTDHCHCNTIFPGIIGNRNALAGRQASAEHGVFGDDIEISFRVIDERQLGSDAPTQQE